MHRVAFICNLQIRAVGAVGMRGQLAVAHWLSFVDRSYNYAIMVSLTEIKAPVTSVVPVRFIDCEVG
jgi:hypothetical protein